MTSAAYLYTVLALAGIITIAQIIRTIQCAMQLTMYRELLTLQKKLIREQIKLIVAEQEKNDGKIDEQK